MIKLQKMIIDKFEIEGVNIEKNQVSKCPTIDEVLNYINEAKSKGATHLDFQDGTGYYGKLTIQPIIMDNKH